MEGRVGEAGCTGGNGRIVVLPCQSSIGDNLAIYQSRAEVLKKRDTGSRKRDKNFSLTMLVILSYT